MVLGVRIPLRPQLA
uniref:Uncharacterized protein n=1 Tax=Vitis vinifera TaxID=29760 RepID=F6HYP0_VITVI